MRQGTIVLLLALIVLFAVFGFKVFGFLLAFALAVVLLAVVTVVVGVWAIKRRMRRNLEALTQALAGERGGPAFDPTARASHPSGPGRPDAIDVEGRVRPTPRTPRDGADAPEDPGESL